MVIYSDNCYKLQNQLIGSVRLSDPSIATFFRGTAPDILLYWENSELEGHNKTPNHGSKRVRRMKIPHWINETTI